ncbi:hypothetical protein [Flavobacterium luteolum]|uniref:hypothetical protein n=1 Tax=Flavobacterium luteolum TaxID=3003259 RepID=UPI00248EDF08|nr:hypothetical protein [Flavobacterium luteolum]
MKISKKVNSYLLHLLYLFMYFAVCLCITIIFDLYSSNTKRIEITPGYLLGCTPLPIIYWIIYTASGTLSKKFNLIYDKNEEEKLLKNNSTTTVE